MASSLETNKLLAAILTAGIIASGSGVISSIIYHPAPPREPVYQVAVAEAEGEAAEAGGGEPQAAPLPVLLADASAEEGENVARACAACHSFEQGGPAKIGPPLWDVAGRDIASLEGFAYSDALAGKEGEWTFEHLSAFIENPQEWAPGTKMSYAGLGDAEERADLLAYLRSLSEDPVPLPEVTEEMQVAAEGGAAAEGEAAAAEQPEGEQEAAAASQDGAAAGGDGLGARIAAASPEEGESAVRVCAACHSFEQGGPNKIGPALWGVVGRDIAGLEDFSYSDALQQKEGSWTYEHLDAYLANPREWAPGTKMSFAGIGQEDERADVIAYLRTLAEEPEPLPGGGQEQAAAEEAQPEAAAGGAQEQGAAETQAAAEGGEQEQVSVEDVQARLEEVRRGVAGGDQQEQGGQDAGASEQAAAQPEGDEATAQSGTAQQPAGQPEDQQQTAAVEQESDEGAAAGGGGLGTLLADASAEEGESAVRVCAACHTFEQGGQARIGPPLWGVVGRDIAGLEDYSYSDALQEKEGEWTYEHLDAYLRSPREWAPGTKMSFAGITQDDRRADVIMYLRSLAEEPAPLPGDG